MIWESLKHGIDLEKLNIFLRWNASILELEATPHANVIRDNGQTQISWGDNTLLGIEGVWTAIFLPNEKFFQKIQLRYVGDDISVEKFRFFEKYLTTKLGVPDRNIDDDRDKLSEWSNKNLFISIYLFEMHAYHCNLTIGVKEHW